MDGAGCCALSLLSAAATGAEGRGRRRREREEPLTDGSSSVQSDAEVARSEAAPRQRQRKYRKGTNTLRKEEKERLAGELEQLQARVAELRRRASEIQAWQVVDGGHAPALQAVRDKVVTNQLEYARVMAIMSGYNLCSLEGGNPIHEPIHLVYDRDERIASLKKSRDRRLRRAKLFFESRRPALGPYPVVREEHRFETSDGEFCAARFSAFHFKGVYSTRRVFDLMQYYMSNVEISMTEKMGHVTVRENEDGCVEGIAQNRLVSTIGSGVKMESNTILFSEFNAADSEYPGSPEYGLFVLDTVDRDAKYPYRPADRVRKDLAAIMEVRSYTQRELGISDSDEIVTVLTRWMYSRLRTPTFPVAKESWLELQDAMDRWGRSIQQTLLESLFPEGEPA